MPTELRNVSSKLERTSLLAGHPSNMMLRHRLSSNLNFLTTTFVTMLFASMLRETERESSLHYLVEVNNVEIDCTLRKCSSFAHH